MHKHTLLAIAIATVPLIAQADITSATLYPSHAQLTWAHSEQVEAGAGTVIIEGLPESLQANSLNVSLAGVDGAQLRQVQVQRVEQADYVAEETRSIRKQLAEVSLRIQQQQDVIQSWNQQVTLMSSAAKASHQLSASELNEMAAALKTTTQSALSEIRGIREAMSDDLALKDRLERELSAVRQDARATKTVQVRYQVPGSGRLQVTLGFQTPQARWRSEYTARLNTEPEAPAKGELALEHLAVIQQTTGVDWNSVEVRLSTANARRGTGMPPVHSWVVSPEQPLTFSGKSSVSRADAPMMEVSQEQTVAINRQSTFTQSYKLQQPADLPSGSAEQRITVSEHTMPVNIATWAAPVLDATGYLHATGTLETESPLPTGRVTLFRDNQSVGQSRLPDIADGEELALGFGVDRGIGVTVVNELERSGEEGLWKSENVQRRQNRFEVTNHHAQAVQVRIFDRLPVSQKDILTVKPLEISEPVQRNVDDKKGVLAWEREVPAGETVTLKSGFEVRVPEGTSLPRL
ncbi:MAG: DUF4139 domain-containing protein [Marinobacter sp.]|uniref:DUF4139 domain-containing protein n=1 Tax=Marinobacter sp. TaxID=50741 RepID=UPI003F9A0847